METQTMTPTNETGNNIENIRKLIDRPCEFEHECPESINSIRESKLGTVRDLIETFERNFVPEESERLPEMLEKLTAFTRITVFDVLIESFAYYVNDLIKKVDDKEHIERFRRIEAYLNYVREKLRSCGEMMKELVRMLKEIIHSESNAYQGLHKEFGHLYDLIANDLNSSTDLLDRAAKELEEGFDSIKSYIRSCKTGENYATGLALAGSAFATTAIFLMPVIGACITAGTVAFSSRLAWGIIVRRVGNAMEDATQITDIYNNLLEQKEEMGMGLPNVKGTLEAHSNARKLAEVGEQKRKLEDEYAHAKDEIKSLKVQHQNDDEEITRMKEQQLRNQEELRQLKEQRSARSRP